MNNILVHLFSDMSYMFCLSACAESDKLFKQETPNWITVAIDSDCMYLMGGEL